MMTPQKFKKVHHSRLIRGDVILAEISPFIDEESDRRVHILELTRCMESSKTYSLFETNSDSDVVFEDDTKVWVLCE